MKTGKQVNAYFSFAQTLRMEERWVTYLGGEAELEKLFKSVNNLIDILHYDERTIHSQP